MVIETDPRAGAILNQIKKELIKMKIRRYKDKVFVVQNTFNPYK